MASQRQTLLRVRPGGLVLLSTAILAGDQLFWSRANVESKGVEQTQQSASTDDKPTRHNHHDWSITNKRYLVCCQEARSLFAHSPPSHKPPPANQTTASSLLSHLQRNVNPISHLSLPFRIMSNNLNLHPHIILSQSRNPHTSPQRLMIRHPLLEIPHHSIHTLAINRHMIGINTKNLTPTFAPSIFQKALHVLESKINLGVDFAFEGAG